MLSRRLQGIEHRMLCAGGPKQDIVVPALRAGDQFPQAAVAASLSGQHADVIPVGFLADDVKSYAKCIVDAICMSEEERTCMAEAGRRRAAQFSHEQFANAWMTHTAKVLPAAGLSSGEVGAHTRGKVD